MGADTERPAPCGWTLLFRLWHRLCSGGYSRGRVFFVRALGKVPCLWCVAWFVRDCSRRSVPFFFKVSITVKILARSKLTRRECIVHHGGAHAFSWFRLSDCPYRFDVLRPRPLCANMEADWSTTLRRLVPRRGN